MQFTVAKPFPVVRACVPLDADRYFDPTRCPFTVTSPSGVALRTQWESVSRDASGLVSVAEFIAENPGHEIGDFTVGATVAALDTRCRPGPFAAAWLRNGPAFRIDDSVPTVHFDERHDRFGPMCVTQRFHARHFVGWLTVYHGLDIVDLVFDFHNGEVGSGHFAFDSLLLEIAGLAGYVTPLPEPDIEPGPGALVLVAPRADGLHHVLPQRSRRPFRIILHDGANGLQAQQYAAGDGWGVAIGGWRANGGFQPHSLPLPDLSTKVSEARGVLSGIWHNWRDAIANGTSIGIGTIPGHPYPAQGSETDWLHPGGQQYGGATSGSERYQYGLEGVLTAATSLYDGILALLARSTLYAQRMPSLILESNGGPAKLEDYLDAQGNPIQGWRMSSANTQFDSGGGHVLDGPFGFSANAALPAGACPEFTEQLKYDELDFQHQDRWFQPLVSLAYLTNDPWAIWSLRCAAETWRMSQFSGNRLGSEYARVMAHKHVGTDWGRAHGECWTMCAAAYALSGDTWRDRWRSWIDNAAVLLVAAQMPNGMLRSSVATAKDGSVFDGCWDGVNKVPLQSVTKISEECQLVCFLAAYGGCVSTGLVPGLLGALKAWGLSMQDFLDCKFPAWAAVGPPDRTSPRYTGVSPLIDTHVDKEEVGSGLGYALFTDGDEAGFSRVLHAYTGKPIDPLSALLGRPLTQSPGIDDTAPLIAALQQP